LATNVYICVLGVAEMELIFPIAALIVLCFVMVLWKALITHHCFGYCWVVLAQHKDCLSNITLHTHQ